VSESEGRLLIGFQNGSFKIQMLRFKTKARHKRLRWTNEAKFCML